MICMSMKHCVWLSDYTDKDIEPLAKLLDHNMPIPYGFVIPSSVLSTIFLAPRVQEKLLHLFELGNISSEMERKHITKLISQIISKAKPLEGFYAGVHFAYEHLLTKEREYRNLDTHDLHKAYHLLKHAYTPPVVRLALLPNLQHENILSGEIALENTIVEIIAKYIDSHIGSAMPQTVPSILVQRALDSTACGYCETVNTHGNRSDQMVICAFPGAKELEFAPDVYMVQKEGASIISRHSAEQPFKYVLKGNGYKEVALHPSEVVQHVLTDSQIQGVAFLAKDFEKEVYFPQKISFAFERGNLFVTKLRTL